MHNVRNGTTKSFHPLSDLGWESRNAWVIQMCRLSRAKNSLMMYSLTRRSTIYLKIFRTLYSYIRLATFEATFDTTPELSIEWMPVLSLNGEVRCCVKVCCYPVGTFFHSFCQSPSLPSLPPSIDRVVFLLQCRVPTVSSVVPPLPRDSSRGKQCVFLLWLHNGRLFSFCAVIQCLFYEKLIQGAEWIAKVRFIGNQYIFWLCPTTKASPRITLLPCSF